jgi:hypothetical protein
MLCREFEEYISDFCDDLLVGAEKKNMEAHAASCPRCGLLLQDVRAVIQIGNHFPTDPVPPNLETRILAATLGVKERFSWKDLFLGNFAFLNRVPRFVMGCSFVICFLSFSLWRIQMSVPEGSTTTQVLLSQIDAFTHGVYTQGLQLYYTKNRVVSELDYLKTSLTSQIEYSWNQITGGKKKEPVKSGPDSLPGNKKSEKEEKQNSLGPAHTFAG